MLSYQFDHIILLRTIPEIIGILFAGILTCLAIVFGFLNYDELDYIEKKLGKLINIEQYFKNLKNDFKTIFILFIVSITMYLVDFYKILTNFGLTYECKYIVDLTLLIIIFVDMFALFMVLSCAKDIIYSLFSLNELKIEIFKKQNSKQTKISEYDKK